MIGLSRDVNGIRPLISLDQRSLIRLEGTTVPQPSLALSTVPVATVDTRSVPRGFHVVEDLIPDGG